MNILSLVMDGAKRKREERGKEERGGGGGVGVVGETRGESLGCRSASL